MRGDHEDHEDADHRRQGQAGRVDTPDPQALTPQCHHEQHRDPCRVTHRHRIRTRFDRRPGDARQHGEYRAGCERHRARCELTTQHHHTRCRGADQYRAGYPRPQLIVREDVEPAMQQKVIATVHAVDVVQQLPQLRKAAPGRGHRRRLVEPQRRTARAENADDEGHQTHQCGFSCGSTPGKPVPPGALGLQHRAHTAPPTPLASHRNSPGCVVPGTRQAVSGCPAGVQETNAGQLTFDRQSATTG